MRTKVFKAVTIQPTGRGEAKRHRVEAVTLTGRPYLVTSAKSEREAGIWARCVRGGHFDWLPKVDALKAAIKRAAARELVA